MSAAADEVAGSLTVTVAGSDVCSWRLPREQAVSAGRASTAGIRLSAGWVPHQLARFEPVERGWHLVNGHRTRVRVRNPRAERLGTSEQAIKNAANRYRERLNDRRGHSIETLDDLGYYLVHVTGVLGPDDLEP